MATGLSAGELQVLEGLCGGKSNNEIARDLGVMQPTVRLHVKTLYRMIGAANRTQGAMLAMHATQAALPWVALPGQASGQSPRQKPGTPATSRRLR